MAFNTGNPLELLWLPSLEADRLWVYHKVPINLTQGALVNMI